MEIICRFTDILIMFYIFIMSRLFLLAWILLLFCLFGLLVGGDNRGDDSQNINENKESGE
ncbi:Uncharacterised protein [Enterococcus casseliflavus]|nr:hypothetical protein ECA02_30820 [Enterococcus casseliflavus]STP33329.1 Uncharacterised protein [Enterococcus casseliflavus]